MCTLRKCHFSGHDPCKGVEAVSQCLQHTENIQEVGLWTYR